MSGESEKFSLLLVEDDLPLAAVMEEYLGKHGFAVMVEHRGDRAVERILTSRPDLVLLDIMLPGKQRYQRTAAGDHLIPTVPDNAKPFLTDSVPRCATGLTCAARTSGRHAIPVRPTKDYLTNYVGIIYAFSLLHATATSNPLKKQPGLPFYVTFIDMVNPSSQNNDRPLPHPSAHRQ